MTGRPRQREVDGQIFQEIRVDKGHERAMRDNLVRVARENERQGDDVFALDSRFVDESENA